MAQVLTIANCMLAIHVHWVESRVWNPVYSSTWHVHVHVTAPIVYWVSVIRQVSPSYTMLLSLSPITRYEYKLTKEYNWNVKNKASKGYEVGVAVLSFNFTQQYV